MKLTSSLLKRIIMEEINKFGSEEVEDHDSDAEEVDADEYGTDKALEKKINYVKALKIEEGRLRKRLDTLVNTRRRVIRSL
jgi:hypothetical protein